MKTTREELERRFAEADRIRAVLRRATIEGRAVGDRIRENRIRGPVRPDDRRPPGR